MKKIDRLMVQHKQMVKVKTVIDIMTEQKDDEVKIELSKLSRENRTAFVDEYPDYSLINSSVDSETEGVATKKKSVEYYELIELLQHMEKLGHLSERSVWKGYILNWGVTNNTIFWLGFDYYDSIPKQGSVYKSYFTAVNEVLGLPPENDGIWVRASF